MSDIETSNKIRERLINYVMSNPITSITAVGLFIGGLIMLIYLGSENYFPPDINASSIGLLFGAAAIIGIGITLALGLYFILPGMAYKNLLMDVTQPSKTSGGEAEVRSENSKDEEWRRPLHLLRFTIPALIVTIAFNIWVAYLLFTELIDYRLLILVGVVLIAIVCLFWRRVRQEDSSGKIEREEVGGNQNGMWFGVLKRIVRWPRFLSRKNRDIKSAVLFVGRLLKVYSIPFGVAVFSGVLFTFPLLFILLFAGKYEENGAPDWLVMLVIFVMSILTIVANHAIARAKKWWVLPTGAVALLFFIMLTFQQWLLIPDAVVRSLSIGDIRNATLLLDEQGCEAAMRNALYDSSVDPKKGLAKCALSSVTVVWRIGNEYWIKSQDGGEDKQWKSVLSFIAVDKADNAKCPEMISDRNINKCKYMPEQKWFFFNSDIRFSIPAAHVLSWSIEVSKSSEVK